MKTQYDGTLEGGPQHWDIYHENRYTYTCPKCLMKDNAWMVYTAGNPERFALKCSTCSFEDFIRVSVVHAYTKN